VNGHALLGPSGSKQWIACPPSARLGEAFADTSGAAAAEGTLAHELCEIMLLHKIGKLNVFGYKLRLDKIKANPMYDFAMQDHCDAYVSTVLAAASKHSVILVEKVVNFSNWVPTEMEAL